MSYIVYMYYILYFQVHTTIHLCCFLYFEFLVTFHCCCVISYFVFSSYFILLTVGEDSTGDGFESNEFQNDICVSYKIMFSQSFAFFILSCFHDMSSFPSYFAFRSKLPQGSQETFISLFLMIYKTI